MGDVASLKRNFPLRRLSRLTVPGEEGRALKLQAIKGCYATSVRIGLEYFGNRSLKARKLRHWGLEVPLKVLPLLEDAPTD
jgi:hypothetical protein